VLARQAALGGPLAVVTHGLVIRAWLQQGPLHLGDGLALPERLANSSLTVAGAAAPHRVSRVDCTLHLAGGAGEDARSLSGG
jgi:hypothetical protein